ncbi:MAG: carbon-nitrogen hydrolase family protein [Pirellulaceae bacterium]|nr:carbon-nitrogen hydrolase family protein [Pirellulaceae bacterium]
MPSTYRIAAVQMDVTLGDPQGNLRRMTDCLKQTAAAGAHLTVFPECSLAGYCYDDLDEARRYAETLPGPATDTLAAVCRRLGVYAVFGLLEADGPRTFNACALVGPEGLVGSYRKLHLPYLGVDRFTTPGDRPLQVHDAGGLRVGLNICYDLVFPEAARVMALDGADLIVLPTNWPPGAECTADCLVSARALENKVYYLAVNRVGQERGFAFIGRSKIANPSGELLAAAQDTSPTVLYAEVDVQRARNKKVIRIAGTFELDRFADRRPEFYHRIIDPVGAPGSLQLDRRNQRAD